ncbi:MAG: arginine--tRNA ligase, partial [Planctomycetes bacterium]|nr:arginine--tRNA ligase [Planctomycetota bacterium]
DRTEYRHVSFGTIMGEDKRPFKARSGDAVELESLLDEAVLRARRIVDENDDAREAPQLDEATRAEVAKIVGLGGIKYADLHHNRESDYIFRWDKMLAKTGDTAAYMQYSFARICGIFRRGNIDIERLRDSQTGIRLTQPQERSLALQLNRFAEEIEATALDLRPNILTQYLFETANCFSTFYDSCPVLKEEEEAIRHSRLLLCDLTARIIEKGLSLLGIQTCQQM